jgi:hypothetical protein
VTRSGVRTAAWSLVLACAGLPRARADIQTRIIPLPVYATLPNEGNTYGVMPIFVLVDREEGETRAILAPSLSWNDTIELTGTMRWYQFPSPTRSITAIASASTHINRNLFFQVQDLPRERGDLTTELDARAERNIFYRFFGFGPDTQPQDESSYTRDNLFLSLREGWNAAGHVNIGTLLELRGDDVERHAVPGLPLAPDRFPTAPGMRGAGAILEGLSLRFNTRALGEYSDTGVLIQGDGAVAEGLAGGGSFARAMWQAIGLWRETSWLSAAARARIEYVWGDNVPFYYQSSLGGERLLRGFTEDRFIAAGAWTAEFEQRIRGIHSHIFGVTTDWRADPFITVGQVFTGAAQIVSNVRIAGGVGLRAFVRPNVLGRIDIGYGGEGAKVYVVIGYPY